MLDVRGNMWWSEGGVKSIREGREWGRTREGGERVGQDEREWGRTREGRTALRGMGWKKRMVMKVVF
jgi:hypothetical protein